MEETVREDRPEQSNSGGANPGFVTPETVADRVAFDRTLCSRTLPNPNNILSRRI